MSDSQFEAFIREVRQDISDIKRELSELTERVSARHTKVHKPKSWWDYLLNK